MSTPARSLTSQRGVSLSGLIVVLALILGVAMLAMKVIPFLLEYKSAKAGIAAAKASNGTPAEMRAAFIKTADVNAITSITGSDLIIYKVNNETEVAFDYDTKIPLFTNVALLLHFAATTDKTGVIPEKPEAAPR